MKLLKIAVLMLLMGCGSGMDSELGAKDTRSTATFSSYDMIQGCYFLGNNTQYSVCISGPEVDGNGNTFGKGIVVESPGSEQCWKVGDIVWWNINSSWCGLGCGDPTDPNYGSQRYNPGAANPSLSVPSHSTCPTQQRSAVPAVLKCDTTTAPATGATILCDRWLDEQVSGGTTRWLRYVIQDIPGYQTFCSGTYAAFGFEVSVPSWTITKTPSMCWSVGDRPWKNMSGDLGSHWFTGTRVNPGDSKVGVGDCPTPQQTAPVSIRFATDCSTFTEHGMYNTMFTRLP